MTKIKKRCQWVNLDNPLYVEYHDKEWGVPSSDERHLFEMLILEGAQAGLSWATVLKKRQNYRKAFNNFDAKTIARYNKKKVEALMNNDGIIRNRLKIESAIKNAKAFLQIQKEFGSFSHYLWDFANHKPIKNRFKTWKDLPAKTELSDTVSKDLKKRGMNFVGPTILYAYLQAIGIVNDHETGCFRYKQVSP